MGLFTGVGATADVGKAVMKSKAGAGLIDAAIASGKITGDAASINKFKASKIAEINKGVLDKINGFTKQLDNAAKGSPNKLIGMGKTLREQSSKYGNDLAIKLGDPKLGNDITKAINGKINDIYKTSMKQGQKNLIGKTTADVGKGGIKSAGDIPEGAFSRFANGTWAKADTPLGRTALVIAGVGFIFSSSFLDLGAGILKTLENIGFLPDGTTSGFISLWGKIRGFITVVLFGALILGTFWIMNMVFGAAKTAKGVVDSVTDNIVPDAEPSGA